MRLARLIPEAATARDDIIDPACASGSMSLASNKARLLGRVDTLCKRPPQRIARYTAASKRRDMDAGAREHHDPIRSPERLAALHRLALLNTPVEPAFDRLTRLASAVLNTPVALVALVAADRQFFKSCIGLPETWASRRETPLSHSFCQHTVVSGAPLIIPDARQHPLVHDNPAITDLGVVADAGIPLITADGYLLGSFCVIDIEPRTWTAREIDILRDLADGVMTEIEVRAAARALEHERGELERRVHARRAALNAANAQLRNELVGRQRAEEAQRASEIHFRSLFDTSTIGLYRTTPDGRILVANPVLAHSLGYASVEELMARNLEAAAYAPGYTRRQFREQIEQDGKITGLEAAWTTKDGTCMHVRESAKVVCGADGEVLYYEGTVEDITEYKRAEEALQQAHIAAMQLEELDRLRATFVTSVSHDLRTPLTAARAVLILLGASATDRLRPEEQRLVENAQRNIEHLGRLIDDLLVHNHLEAGSLQLHPQPTDLRMIVTDVLVTIDPLLRQKRQILALDLAEPLPTSVDVHRLEQALVNVIANAHEHTPPATRITIRGWVVDNDVVVSVHDTGPGIPAEELETIFQRFYQLNLSDGGSGLGLAIARAIVAMHGGRMWAQSHLHVSTTFYVAVPRALHGSSVCH